MHFSLRRTFTATRQGCNLSLEFGTTDANPLSAIEAAPAKRRGLLPVLVILFLISYALMTMLIVEQGRTIESQRTLIHDLFRQSTELAAAKLKNQQDDQLQSSQSVAKNPSSQNPSAVAPSTQAPAHKALPKQSPSTQAVPQPRAQNRNSNSHFTVPTRPASDVNDAGRSLITI
jgi:cytoskeletal protein RodZ